MRGQGENVPPAPTGSDQSVTPGFTYEEWFTELANEYKMQFKQPGEFSVRDFMLTTGGTEENCRDYLERKVKAGKLRKRTGVICDKGRHTVYKAL